MVYVNYPPTFEGLTYVQNVNQGSISGEPTEGQSLTDCATHKALVYITYELYLCSKAHFQFGLKQLIY